MKTGSPAPSTTPDRSTRELLVGSVRTAAERLGIIGSLKELRRLPERRLHGLRRRIVLKRLRSGSPGPMLFVCHGNIYRSPYGAAAFQVALPPFLREVSPVCSAGFVGPDRPSPEPALLAAKRRGIDLNSHRSQILTPQLVHESRWIVVMDASQGRAIIDRFGTQPERIIVLGDLDPLPIRARTIRDPWNQSIEVLEESYDRIDRCVSELARALLK